MKDLFKGNIKVAVIGSGGREYAIAKAISKNQRVEKLYVLPGNGGMEAFATCINISANDISGVKNFVKTNGVDYVVVTPDEPLAIGMVDELTQEGISCFGPTKDCALLEASKAYSKDFMKRKAIPTANYEIFTCPQKAKKYLATQKYPIVIKASGLALGKGAVIVNSLEEAFFTIDEIMVKGVFGKSGDEVVIEEFLEGVEISVFILTDGETIVPLLSSMDHKKIFEGEVGLNTGGMGAIAPNPYYTESVERECMEKIVLPTIKGLKEDGKTYKGCLYVGLMLTKEGLKVIEYNSRFGDPETQAIIPLLESDLLEAFIAVSQNKLKEVEVKFSPYSSCCVCVVSKGYPENYKKGYEIEIDDSVKDFVAIAGAKRENEKLLTNGGRVLNVVAVDDCLKGAIIKAYQRVEKVSFTDCFYRKDIGQSALKVIEENELSN